MGKLQKDEFYRINDAQTIIEHIQDLMGKGIITSQSIRSKHLHIIYKVCSHGHMSVFQWLLEKPNEPKLSLDEIDLPKCFSYACYNDLNMAQYLLNQIRGYNLNVVIYGNNVPDITYLSSACRDGNLPMVQWLLSLRHHQNHADDWEKFDIHADDDKIFQNACGSGNVEIPKLLMSLEDEVGQFNIHCYSDAPFVNACHANDIETTKWLISLEDERGQIDIHVGCEYAFVGACAYGHLELLQWLITLEQTHGPFNIHIHHWEAPYHVDLIPDEPYRAAKKYGHEHVCQWLRSLEPTHGKIEVNK